MTEILHNPNCLLSPTRHHEYICGWGYEICKHCGLRHDNLVSYIDEDDDRNKRLFGGMWNKESSRKGGLACIGVKRTRKYCKG